MFDKLSISSKTEKILTKSLDESITVEEANHLMNIRGQELYPLLATADFLRHQIVGDNVTFINNCNINFTNICTVRCGFCAFGKDADDPEAYILNDEQILAKAEGAVANGAREFTLMGGVLKDADIDYYKHLLTLLKDNFPDLDFIAEDLPHADEFPDGYLHSVLCRHLSSCGFILRYPEGKSAITGYDPESWHIRYTGMPHSIIMEKEHLVLEEYLQVYKH